jgi:hypothetical protein
VARHHEVGADGRDVPLDLGHWEVVVLGIEQFDRMARVDV